MKTKKPILDACCGGRMFYFNKDDERVLFQDIRNIETTLCDGRKFAVNPDVSLLIDWLNKNHFDYRGLIKKGLAIDATGLDVYDF